MDNLNKEVADLEASLKKKKDELKSKTSEVEDLLSDIDAYNKFVKEDKEKRAAAKEGKKKGK